MFFLTLKWNKKTAVMIIATVAVLLCLIVILAGAFGKGSKSRGLKTNSDRLEYLASLGWQCDAEPLEEQAIVLPREFNAIFTEYNNLQKQQGFDLSQYAGLELTAYRYKVKNYPGESGGVIAQLLLLNYEVVGGDIHSTALNGFMHGIK